MPTEWSAPANVESCIATKKRTGVSRQSKRNWKSRRANERVSPLDRGAGRRPQSWCRQAWETSPRLSCSWRVLAGIKKPGACTWVAGIGSPGFTLPSENWEENWGQKSSVWR